jgi:hypothetical protein
LHSLSADDFRASVDTEKAFTRGPGPHEEAAMKHLVESFQKNKGIRGVTFYDSEGCNFLAWDEVLKFISTFPVKSKIDPFAEKLTETLANYDPDREFLAVQQNGDSVSVELYSQAQ